MTGHCHTSNALALLLLLTGASFLHPSNSHPVGSALDGESPRSNAPYEQTASEGRGRTEEERRPVLKDEAEEDDELFEDVDPKTLAAVLLEALNHSHVERRGEEGDRAEEERKSKEVEVKEDDTEDDLDGDQAIKRLLATRGNDREKEEEEERRKAQEEEEAMTEKVTSRTTSHTVQVQTEHRLSSAGDNADGAEQQKGPTTPEQGSNEKEEQLSSGELKSLETMMKEFPRLNTAAKREGDNRENQRESRGYSSHDGSTLAMSKKKLKWQEETQKALNFPTFRGGNFMDDMVGSNYDTYPAQSLPPAEKAETEDAEPEQREEEEEEEEEEVLSPEEEEAQAKAEQEEMRRQAAEAQKAKMEEEKLADIASDMLLRYMVKQSNGKKYGSALSNAAEDKRSNEVLEVTEEDDIDPQTIDKLIEISSKLHLPADDVVDIISDVEKKKKKNATPEAAARWRKPVAASSAASFPSDNGLQPSGGSDGEKNGPAAKQPSTAVNRLKTWFRDRAPTKALDLWGKPARPLLADPGLRPKPQKPLSVYQDLWLQSPKSAWSGYRSYPSYYQRYPDTYPVYVAPPSRPKLHYYAHKPALNLNALLRNTADDVYALPPRRYSSWARPWLRKRPVELQRKPYYARYPLPLYPWTFQPVPMPRSHPFPQMAALPAPQRQLYYPPSAPAVKGNRDYYVSEKQTGGSDEDLKKMFMNRPKLLD